MSTVKRKRRLVGFTLSDEAIAVAKQEAESAGLSVSRWVDLAILNEGARRGAARAVVVCQPRRQVGCGVAE